MPYLTPDEVPDNATCRALFVPNNEQFLAIVRGALQVLTLPESWTPHGTLTPQESADAFVDMFDRFCFNEGSCRLIGEIVLYAGADNPFPDKWLPCDGNERLVADWPELYAVIGHIYGEHDVDHFWLPNLFFRVAMGANATEGFPVGTYMGVDDETLDETHIPIHAHDIPAYDVATVAAGVDVTVVIPTESSTQTGEWGSDDPEPITHIPPALMLGYYIVAKDG